MTDDILPIPVKIAWGEAVTVLHNGRIERFTPIRDEQGDLALASEVSYSIRRQAASYWYSDEEGGSGRPFNWKPHLNMEVGCILTLDIGHATKEACDEYIQEWIIGAEWRNELRC